MLKVISVNVGERTSLPVGKANKTTGIFKRPVSAAVEVTTRGLVGDQIVSKKHHGGPDQAVYVYTQPDYDYWTEHLGDAPEPGTFGENLLLSDLASAELRVGDRLALGGPDGALLEVTAPRIPCATLAARMDDPTFVKRFARAGRPGAYTRVLRAGTVRAGDGVIYTPAPPDAPTILELFELWYEKTPQRERLLHYLQFPLAARLRKDVEERLADLA